MTLNKDKCSFGITKISMLGQILENGTKRPDPERLQTLMNYPVPNTAVQLRRRFFRLLCKMGERLFK